MFEHALFLLNFFHLPVVTAQCFNRGAISSSSPSSFGGFISISTAEGEESRPPAEKGASPTPPPVVPLICQHGAGIDGPRRGKRRNKIEFLGWGWGWVGVRRGKVVLCIEV